MSAVRKYEKACLELAQAFIKKYYLEGEDGLEEEEIDDYWVADDIGGVLYINDRFFTMDNMAEAMRLEVELEDLSAWYEQSVTEDGGVSLRYFLKRKHDAA